MSRVPVRALGRIAADQWGLVTTAQAGEAGVSRNALSRLAAGGALDRVAQGVYRMAGAPERDHEPVYAIWLALGGASTRAGNPEVVAAGETAALLHGIGDFYPDGHDFIVPRRKTTRLSGVRLRTRTLQPGEHTFAEGIPTLTLERTIADLVDLWTDRSLIADALAAAATQGKIVSYPKLAGYLQPLAAANSSPNGETLAAQLFAAAGLPTPAGANG